MPRNSSRKKIVRRRATRHGERYTRALHATGAAGTQRDEPRTAQPDTAPEAGTETAAFDELDAAVWECDLQRIRAVQQLVESRGWVVDPDMRDELDDDGHATGTDVFWDYALAFGAAVLAGDELEEHLAEDHPRRPECSFGWEPEAGGLVVVVQTAGNWGGCPHHRTTRHTLPMNDDITAQLPWLLATVEDAARKADAALLLACTMRGPCGERAQRRAEYRHRLSAWSTAMARAGKDLSPEKMAELLAWEDEHLGRTIGPDGEPVGTSDWPGWIPLIGPPPWRKALIADDPGPAVAPS